jgi:hypothetical protein
MNRSAIARRSRGAAIGFSVFAHLLMFIVIAVKAPKMVFRDQPTATANVWLMPRRTLQNRLSRPRAATAAPGAPMLPAAKAAASPPSPAPAPAAPQSSTPAAPIAGGAPAAGAGVQGALRTSIGCDIGHAAHLTPEEKDRCNQRMGEEAHKGPTFIDTIPPEKRAYYDAVQQAYQTAHDPMHPFVRDRYGNIEPWGKGPGVGCGMKFGGPPQPPDHRSLTDKIKATGLLGVDLGPLKCGIVIPQGSMTPEIGIPTP